MSLKPSESYPKQKISEIDVVLANMKKDTDYAAKLKEASDNLAQKKYEEAKKSYQKALKIKPKETYPVERIQKIDQLLANQKTQKENLAKYKQLIAQANVAFDAKKYKEAKTLYQQSSVINTTAQYPKNKILAIDKLLAQKKKSGDNAKSSALRYASYIQKGDVAFSKKQYSSAKSYYSNALRIKPGEKYPTDKIAEIKNLTAPKAGSIPQEINFADKSEKQKFMSEMAKKYGEGIHEENYSSKSGKKVRRIIVVKAGLADEYREVKQPWGATYYFKNGKNISQSVFLMETKKK